MLPYSTHGSSDTPDAGKVAKATRLVREKNPTLLIDGELQFDSAVVPAVAAIKAPSSSLAGHANIFVFSNLNASNLGCKIAEKFAGVELYGAVLRGLAKPINDLSRGCASRDIVAMAAFTVLQAQKL